MPALLLYLLQVNAGFLLLYLTYQLVLRPTTFYQINRWYLAGGLLLICLLPLFDFSGLFEKNQQVHQTLATFSGTWTLPAVNTSQETAFNYWQLPVYLFWLGAGVMAVRLLVQMSSLYKLHKRSQRATFQGIPYRRLPVAFPPFSFANTIYFNPALHPQHDWLPILKHEHTHVQQWHTLDILLIEFTCLFHWFNPAVWLLRDALKQNLEFLTDQQTLEAGIDRKHYQVSLLQTAGAPPVAFTSSFNYHSLKHRIMMMNKAPSSKIQKVRFLAVLPLLVLSLLGFQGIAKSGTQLEDFLPQEKQTGSSSAAPNPKETGTLPSPGVKEGNLPQTTLTEGDFIRRNPAVNYLDRSKNSINVVLKSGKVDSFANTKSGIAAAEKKYGPLPQPPAAMPPAQIPAPQQGPSPQQQYEAFLQRNPGVKGLRWNNGTLFVHLKNGETESYPSTIEGYAQVEKKYGSLPTPPPPPAAPPAAPLAALAPPPPPPPMNVTLTEEFKQRNPTVRGISAASDGLHVIFTSGEVETFDNTASGRTAFEKKFGTLPPPPPPVRKIKKDN